MSMENSKQRQKTSSLYPALYQINTRVKHYPLENSSSLDDWSDAELDQLAAQGFDWIWLLGVWQTGLTGQRVSRHQSVWQDGFRQCLPDLVEQDICGSCFAITRYQVDAQLGGKAALQKLRARLNARGMRLMLDFVPNHTALDHPWVRQHPEFYIRRGATELAQQPQNYITLDTDQGQQIFAYGRDPYFDGWPDALQLDYSNPALQVAMQAELQQIATLCDGLRCDMAMLILPDIFQRTWGQTMAPFWPSAIRSVREQFPEFVFLAEVYWDLEWTLQQQGFDYAYDKKLYDRLRDQHARPVREHLVADLSYQNRLTRFLENHDEPRAAASFTPPAVHQAAAIINYLLPGMRFFHEGQLEGKQTHIPVHLCRGPNEPVDPELSTFYQQLLQLLQSDVLRNGQWQLLECVPAWDGNWSSDNFIAYRWRASDDIRLIAVVNYAAQQGQCRVKLPELNVTSEAIAFVDRLCSETETGTLDVSAADGLFFDLPAWAYRVLEFSACHRGE